LDNDGLLDLVVLRYLRWDFDDIWCGEHKEGEREYCHPDVFQPIAPLVYHNDGKGHFTEVSQKIGLAKPGKGLGIALADYDRDGLIDIFVANDNERNFLFRNRGGKGFYEVGVESVVAYTDNGIPVSSMGVDFRDWDNNGRPSILVTALGGETFPLFHNEGNGLFSDDSYKAGVGFGTFQMSGWGAGIQDLDNDGYKDIFIGNG